MRIGNKGLAANCFKLNSEALIKWSSEYALCDQKSYCERNILTALTCELRSKNIKATSVYIGLWVSTVQQYGVNMTRHFRGGATGYVLIDFSETPELH